MAEITIQTAVSYGGITRKAEYVYALDKLTQQQFEDAMQETEDELYELLVDSMGLTIRERQNIRVCRNITNSGILPDSLLAVHDMLSEEFWAINDLRQRYPEIPEAAWYLAFELGIEPKDVPARYDRSEGGKHYFSHTYYGL